MRKRTARIVGSLFIIATTAGVLSAVLLGSPAPQRVADLVVEHRDRMTWGAVAILIMAVAIAMIAPMLLPVLKEYGEGAAAGYVVARSMEVVLLLPAAIGPLLLLSVSGAQASAEGTTSLQTLWILTSTYETWGHPVSALFFCLSVILLNGLLFRSRLVPRLISGWALVAVLPYLADAFMVMFGVLPPTSPLHSVLFAPLALNELVLALWLLARGLTPNDVSHTVASSIET
jgi:hypothetical protein